MKPTHRRFVMSDLMSVSSRCLAASKSAKELRGKLEAATEGLFLDRKAAALNSHELITLLEEALDTARIARGKFVAAAMIGMDDFADNPPEYDEPDIV